MVIEVSDNALTTPDVVLVFCACTPTVRATTAMIPAERVTSVRVMSASKEDGLSEPRATSVGLSNAVARSQSAGHRPRPIRAFLSRRRFGYRLKNFLRA